MMHMHRDKFGEYELDMQGRLVKEASKLEELKKTTEE